MPIPSYRLHLILSCSSSSPYFLLPVILKQVNLSLICLKNAVPKLGWRVKMFLVKSKLAFLSLKLINGLHLVVKPLYLLSLSLHFMVDLDTDKPTPWNVLYLNGSCKAVFLHRGKDPEIIHHCWDPWMSMPFWVPKLASVLFFSECTKLLISAIPL